MHLLTAVATGAPTVRFLVMLNNSPRACMLAHSGLWPRSSGTAPWWTCRRTRRSASLQAQPQMEGLCHATSAAAAGKSPRSCPGWAAGRWRRDVARTRISTTVWFCSWIPAGAAGSYSSGKAIPTQWVKRRGREPPDTASPTPGAPSSLAPGDSHITGSRWIVSGRPAQADQQPVEGRAFLKAHDYKLNSYTHWVQIA